MDTNGKDVFAGVTKVLIQSCNLGRIFDYLLELQERGLAASSKKVHLATVFTHQNLKAVFSVPDFKEISKRVT